MEICIKLGKQEEIDALSVYKGPFKSYEIPSKYLKINRKTLKSLKKYGYHFNVHGLNEYTNKTSAELIRRTCRYLELADDIECSNYVLHGLVWDGISKNDKKEQITCTENALSEIVGHSSKFSVKCLVENGTFIDSGVEKRNEVHSSPLNHISICKKLDVGMVVDIGHLLVTTYWQKHKIRETVNYYLTNTKNIAVVHLSDNLLKSDDHMGLGEGKADLKIYENLINYCKNAVFTIETFPNGIYKSLCWLIKQNGNEYSIKEAEELCGLMKWKSGC